MKLDAARITAYAAPISGGPVAVDWALAAPVDWPPEDLERDPPAGASFAPIAPAALKRSNYDAWTKQFTAWLAANSAIELLKSPSTGEVSRPDESERDFRARLQQASRESRDASVDALRRKFALKIASIEERLRRARQAVARETEQATGQKIQTAISVGATLVGALFGRKAMSAGTVGRATTAMRGVGRSMKESEDIARANETVAALEQQRRQLDDDLAAETGRLEAVHDAVSEPLEAIAVKPKKQRGDQAHRACLE